MIYPLTGLLAGALLGALRARQRGGKMLDILQWALVHAMILGVIGMFILVVIERNVG